MISAVSIIDPQLSYPHRLVLSILALHANRYGKAEPTQDRIAALAGWFCTDKETGNKEPNARYVSTLINNENHTKKSDRCGPGLVQLGYVKAGFKQNGFNQPNTYQLVTPSFSNGDIRRPDGTTTKARFTAPTPREDTKAYKARKAMEQDAYARNEPAPRKAFTAEDQLPIDFPDVFTHGGEEFTREDCLLDLEAWQEGFQRAVPDAVYYHFKVEMPNSRDADF